MATSPNPRDLEPGQGESSSAAPASRLSSGSWFFLAFLALLGLLVVAFLFLPKQSNARKLTRLSLQPLAAKEPPLTLDDLQGKVVLLNFWGTWCPPCVGEFPAIVAMAKQYGARADFRVVAVSCGHASDDETKMAGVRLETQAFLDQRFLKFPVYLDVDETTRRAVREEVPWPQDTNGVLQYPVTLLLDRKHRIRNFWFGPAKQETFTEEIEKVLNE